VVTTTADSGPGSLRDAINQINADTGHTLYASPSNPSVDEIDFNITAASDTGGGYNSTTGVATIAPQSALPTITNHVIIDGYTQPGSSPNTNPMGGADPRDNAVRLIVLDGSRGGASFDGLDVFGGNSTIRGLVLQNFSAGVSFFTNNPNALSNGNVVTGDDITSGVDLEDSSGNTIGGTTPAARNLISGGVAVFIAGDIGVAPSNNNLVEGNYIGVDTSGLAVSTNQNSNLGIDFIGLAQDNTIGGTSIAARNVISGWNANVEMDSDWPISDCTGNILEGNYIGTDATGTVALPGPFANTGGGISLNASGNTIGGLTSTPGTGAGNLISGSGFWALQVGGDNNMIQGNLIGTDAGGHNPLPNS
jgi:hypothetical protein